MGQVHWSEPALDDLRDIVSFVAKDSPAYASRLASRISEAPRRLAAFPRFGLVVPVLGQPKIRELWVRTASSTWSVTLTAIFSRSFTGAEIFPDSHPWTSKICRCIKLTMTHRSGGDVEGRWLDRECIRHGHEGRKLFGRFGCCWGQPSNELCGRLNPNGAGREPGRVTCHDGIDLRARCQCHLEIVLEVPILPVCGGKKFREPDRDHVELIETGTNGLPRSRTAGDPIADVKDISQRSRGNVCGQLPFEVCRPDLLGVCGPGFTIEEGIEDHICVQQNRDHRYFLIRSSSMIRSHSSSVGAGPLVLRSPMTWSSDIVLGGAAIEGVSAVSRMRRARVIRMGRGQALTRSRTSARSLSWVALMVQVSSLDPRRTWETNCLCPAVSRDLTTSTEFSTNPHGLRKKTSVGLRSVRTHYDTKTIVNVPCSGVALVPAGSRTKTTVPVP